VAGRCALARRAAVAASRPSPRHFRPCAADRGKPWSIHASRQTGDTVNESSFSVKLPDALVLHPRNGLFFEDGTARIEADEFAATLWPGTVLVLRRMQASPEHFAAVAVRVANSQDLHLPDLIQGVLWRRQAVIEADRDISAFVQAASCLP